MTVKFYTVYINSVKCKYASHGFNNICEWKSFCINGATLPQPLLKYGSLARELRKGHGPTTTYLYTPLSYHLLYRWEVKCCRVLGKCTRDCYLSDAINEADGGMNHSQEKDEVFFTGIFSTFATSSP